MPLPLHVVLQASRALRDEALTNKRRKPEKRVAMFVAAQMMLPRYIGRLLLEEAMQEQQK